MMGALINFKQIIQCKTECTWQKCIEQFLNYRYVKKEVRKIKKFESLGNAGIRD